MRVLFVDDDVRVCRSWERLARSRLGATVSSAASARTGIAAFDDERPDALVLDARLRAEDPADRSGLDVLRHARRRAFAGPAFVVSGIVSPDLRQASLAAGATDCVQKNDFSDALASYLAPRGGEAIPGCELLGRSAAMRRSCGARFGTSRACGLRLPFSSPGLRDPAKS